MKSKASDPNEHMAMALKHFAEKKEYKRNNILMKEIEDAGHFPWIENPKSVVSAFETFLRMF